MSTVAVRCTEAGSASRQIPRFGGSWTFADAKIWDACCVVARITHIHGMAPPNAIGTLFTLAGRTYAQTGRNPAQLAQEKASLLTAAEIALDLLTEFAGSGSAPAGTDEAMDLIRDTIRSARIAPEAMPDPDQWALVKP